MARLGPAALGRVAVATAVLTIVAACGGSGGPAAGGVASGAPASPSASASAPASGGPATPAASVADALAGRITPDGLRVHLAALDAVARANGGHRATGTPGYDASAAYVADALTRYGYAVVRQRFDASTWHDPGGNIVAIVGPGGRAFRDGQDFRAFGFSTAGDVTGRVVSVVDPCAAGAFAGDVAGAIVIAGGASCPWAPDAFRAGVAAVIVDSGMRSGEVPKVSFGPDEAPVPMLLASRETAAALQAAAPHATGPDPSPADAVAHVRVTGSARTVTTENVLADLAGSDPDRVLVVGAHLDSVEGGPGIDDDGSGVATVLEIARLLAGSRPRATIRFALFSAEELGMRGAEAYVLSLPGADLVDIEGYLNADMLGAPNGIRGVYVGPRMVRLETDLMRRLVGYLKAAGLPFELVDVVEATDAMPFNEAGIPVLGVISLTGEPKTAALAATYGGRAGAMDACYHLACDDLANVDVQRTAELAAALGWTAADVAWSEPGGVPSPTP